MRVMSLNIPSEIQSQKSKNQGQIDVFLSFYKN